MTTKEKCHDLENNFNQLSLVERRDIINQLNVFINSAEIEKQRDSTKLTLEPSFRSGYITIDDLFSTGISLNNQFNNNYDINKKTRLRKCPPPKKLVSMK